MEPVVDPSVIAWIQTGIGWDEAVASVPTCMEHWFCWIGIPVS
ncbi:hypothetical protein Vi05172_g12059 [Venturia inaequalis]|nr:hypothetical protein Vi05172_g12059 [Venturia inaequalis]